MRTTNGHKPVRSSEETVCGAESKARKISSKGLHSTQDVKDLGLALAEDILSGEISHKIAGPVVRSITLTIRTAEFEHSRGNGSAVNLRSGQDCDYMTRREIELLEELEAIRKERAAE